MTKCPICLCDYEQPKTTTIEKEALALVLAVRLFSGYFGTQTVKVYTDHSPLQFIQRMANHNQKLLLRLTVTDAVAQTLRCIKSILTLVWRNHLTWRDFVELILVSSVTFVASFHPSWKKQRS